MLVPTKTCHGTGIQQLPDDVLLNVFMFCNGSDVIELSQVCRSFRIVSNDEYLWKILFRKRFKNSPNTSSSHSYRLQYFQNEQTILGAADDCNIAHGRLPHWDRVDDPRSVFGRVALLHHVSWLHVSGKMTGVHTGKYRVIWRLSVMPRAQYVFDISFRAETERGHLVESNLPRNARLLEFGSDYFDFVLSELLEVHDPFEDVIVECKSTSTDWKTNIALCSVRLEPVIDKTRHASPIYHWMDDDCSVDLLPHGRAGRQVLMTKEGRGRLRLRRLRNLRSSPGASYRPWEPWTTFRWYESLLITLFFLALSIAFAQLLFVKTGG